MKFSKYVTIIGISACVLLMGGCAKSVDTSGDETLQPTEAIVIPEVPEATETPEVTEVPEATKAPEITEATKTPEKTEATETPETPTTEENKTPEATVDGYKISSLEDPAEYGEWFLMDLSAYITKAKGEDPKNESVSIPFRVVNTYIGYEEAKKFVDEYNSTSKYSKLDIGEDDPESDSELVVFEYEMSIPKDFPLSYYSDAITLPSLSLGVIGSADGSIMVGDTKYYSFSTGNDISPNYASNKVYPGDTIPLRLICSLPKGANADSYFLFIKDGLNQNNIGYSKGAKIE